MLARALLPQGARDNLIDYADKRAETWRALAGNLGHWLFRGYGMWALADKESDALVGRVGFLHPPGWPDFDTTIRGEWWTNPAW